MIRCLQVLHKDTQKRPRDRHLLPLPPSNHHTTMQPLLSKMQEGAIQGQVPEIECFGIERQLKMGRLIW